MQLRRWLYSLMLLTFIEDSVTSLGIPCGGTGRAQSGVSYTFGATASAKHEILSAQCLRLTSNNDNEEAAIQDKHVMPRRSVCVLDWKADFSSLAKDLASKLSIPICCTRIDRNEEFLSFTHALMFVSYPLGDETDHAVAIRSVGTNESTGTRRRRRSPKTHSAPPFLVDLLPLADSRLGKRYQGKSGIDLLTKAVAPGKVKGGAFVCDLTAGFGQDSLLLAQSGASRVHMVERDPIVATLLDDALRRLRLVALHEDHPQYQRAVELSRKMTLEVGDGKHVAASLSNNAASSVDATDLPDVCYLDPMFPPRAKSAAVKKNMQILHSLLASQVTSADAPSSLVAESDLLEAAYRAAKLRVVVKRPIHAPPLGGRKPSYDIRGSVNRWDIYMKQRSVG